MLNLIARKRCRTVLNGFAVTSRCASRLLQLSRFSSTTVDYSEEIVPAISIKKNKADYRKEELARIEKRARTAPPPTVIYDADSPWNRHLSVSSKARKASKLKDLQKYVGQPDSTYLGGGLPHPSNFPVQRLEFSGNHHNTKVYKANGPTLADFMQYGGGEGNYDLRRWLRDYTKSMHQYPYEEHQTIINASATDALDKTVQMLLNPGDTMLCDEILYSLTLDMLAPMGIKPIGVEMDADGMIPSSLQERIDKAEVKPRVLYLIPCGQNPTGTSLPLQRREEIYDIAKVHDLIIIEDDPYYFLQLGRGLFRKRLPKSMLSLDTDGRVIRLDSMAKIIMPGLRLGWTTANPFFIERLTRHQEVTIQNASGASQAMALTLLKEWQLNGFVKWLSRLSAKYTTRRDILLSAMEEHLPAEVVTWATPTAGMFVWLEVDVSKHPSYGSETVQNIMDGLFEKFVELPQGVVLVKGSWFATNEPDEGGGRAKGDTFFRATYAFSGQKETERGFEKIGRVIREEFGLKAKEKVVHQVSTQIEELPPTDETVDKTSTGPEEELDK